MCGDFKTVCLSIDVGSKILQNKEIIENKNLVSISWSISKNQSELHLLYIDFKMIGLQTESPQFMMLNVL